MLLQKSKNVNVLPNFTLPEPALSNIKIGTLPISLRWYKMVIRYGCQLGDD
jgi:hypothetical protein